MAATWQAVGSAAAGTGNITVTLPAHLADDILLVFHETNQSTAPAAPSGWAVLAQYAQGANVTTVTVYWTRATGSGTTNPTFIDPGNHQIGVAAVIRGCITTGDPWDYTPSGEGQAGTTTFATTAQTTTVDDCLVFGVISDNTDTASDQMSGEANAALSSFTKRGAFYTTQGNGGGVVIYTGVLATAGSTGSFSGNIATTSAWAGVTFALKPAASSTPISASDTGAAADSASLAADVAAADTGAGADAATVAAAQQAADAGSGADSASVQAQVTMGDTAAAVDVLSVSADTAVSLADTGTGVDVTAVDADAAASDAGASADTAAVSAAVDIADTAASTDDATVTVNVELSDTGSAVDELEVATGSNPTMEDTGAAVDIVTQVDVDVTLTDTASAGEVATTDATLEIEDALVAVDELTVEVILEVADAGTATDDATIDAEQALDDAGTVVEDTTVTVVPGVPVTSPADAAHTYVLPVETRTTVLPTEGPRATLLPAEGQRSTVLPTEDRVYRLPAEDRGTTLED